MRTEQPIKFIDAFFLPRLNVVGFLTHPYPSKLRDDLHLLCKAGSTAEVCMYNVLLGKMFAQAAQLVVDKCSLNMEDIAIIGCHGLIRCYVAMFETSECL
jgi:1,6-anhydro-N-acetylmuramate kinase